MPTIESISSNSSILKETEFIVGDVLGKNIDSKKFCIEPDVPKLLLYTPDGKSVLDTVLLPSTTMHKKSASVTALQISLKKLRLVFPLFIYKPGVSIKIIW